MPEHILCGWVSKAIVNGYDEAYSASAKDQSMSEVRFVNTWLSSIL
jgi:hypothetical protein